MLYRNTQLGLKKKKNYSESKNTSTLLSLSGHSRIGRRRKGRLGGVVQEGVGNVLFPIFNVDLLTSLMFVFICWCLLLYRCLFYNH